MDNISLNSTEPFNKNKVEIFDKKFGHSISASVF